MKPIQVGLLGIGVVGLGTFNVLRRNQEEIKRRAGRGIEITMVADLDVARAQSLVGPEVKVVNDARAVIANPDIDIVIELIGGYGIAKTLVLEAIAAGKHVVTANKALLAVHGTEIFAAASRQGVMVAFEAAVAGGIPIIKALREGLTANRIEWIAGIINGTTNFILSEMRDKGINFDVALKQAQALGYAEADPTFDIEGVDAAHKATIMSRASPSSAPLTSNMLSSWATASSCWASPSSARPTRPNTRQRGLSCASTRAWCPPSG
jgi:homoserine dehydrogenase